MADLNNVLNLILEELAASTKEQNTLVNIKDIDIDHRGNLIYSLANFVTEEYKYSVKTFHPVSVVGDKILFFGEIYESDLKELFPKLSVDSIVNATKLIKVVGMDTGLFAEVVLSELHFSKPIVVESRNVINILFSFLCKKIGLKSSDNFNNKADFNMFLKKWVEYQQNCILARRVIAA